MKSNLLTSLCATAILAGALQTSHAATYTDVDSFGTRGILVNTSMPLNRNFNIAGGDGSGVWGYNPAVEHVTSASVEFLISDDQLFDSAEKVTISLGSDTFINSQGATFLLAIGGVTGNALLDLNADGILTYTIVANEGDFKVWSAILVAHTAANTVPDAGNTVALTGMACLALAGIGRRFRA